VDGEDERAEMGEEGFKRLMKLPEPPTAIFATSDYKAFGAMNAARESGMNIPKDISIIGYDDVKLGEYSYPRLTTVNQNTRKMGQRAAEILLFELEEDHSSLVKDEIVPTLILRDSTAPLSTKQRIRNN
ncbi:LacI family DNA-binding transcriptional regulator, partial [Paenibacillus sp. AR247]|uniref:LacI family DNA-binding transcriptional regulator n=1 Tax=Paenibacillus sp. AR247 TaxID=1631599 RepID=UPI000D4939A7